MLRHKRYGSMKGDLWASGGKYVHPAHVWHQGMSAGINEDTQLLTWEGTNEFDDIAIRAIVHPGTGPTADSSFLLHSHLEVGKYVRVLKCGSSTGIRKCVRTYDALDATYPAAGSGGYDDHSYLEGAEVVFGSVPELSSGGAFTSGGAFDTGDEAMMTLATNSIGWQLAYNDPTRPGWAFSDDDGSFLLKHKTLPYIAVAEAGGDRIDAIGNGFKLILKRCPGDDCLTGFDREDFMTWGWVRRHPAAARTHTHSGVRSPRQRCAHPPLAVARRSSRGTMAKCACRPELEDETRIQRRRLYPHLSWHDGYCVGTDSSA